MNAFAFKAAIRRVLQDLGFRDLGKLLRRDQSGVSVLVAFEKGFEKQWFLSVGFWLHALGQVIPDRVEQTHLYLRLDRLLPASREAILTAGALDDPAQAEAYDRLLELLVQDFDVLLRDLGTDAGLRNAARASQLKQGLMRKEAREYLES